MDGGREGWREGGREEAKGEDLAGVATSKYMQWKLLQYFSTE